MRLIGVRKEQPHSSPFELKGECVLCGVVVWITLGASFAHQQLNADGYACFDCLEQHPEHVAHRDS